MIARAHRARSGITLTEILIAILIMGVGLISLATLFPLGLIRLREATRYGRSGLTFESAADDMDTRALLFRQSFTNTWCWYASGKLTIPRDPFSQDAAIGGDANGPPTNMIASDPSSANSVGLFNGIPFAYDPLWRSLTGVYPPVSLVAPNKGLFDPTLDFDKTYVTGFDEARLGDGYLKGNGPFIRADPDGNPASAYGLQRLTNFIPWSSVNLTPQYAFTTINKSLTPANQPADVAGNVFTSIDDIVFNPTGGSGAAPSSVLPDMSAGSPQADYRFTWFLTGRQSDAGGNGTQFVGEIVVCDGRPFGFDALPNTTALAPAGETVVEAIYGVGLGNSIAKLPVPNDSFGFAVSDRSVMLRWPITMADPVVKTGGWIADVTYERNTKTFASRSTGALTSFARCYWYQVAKRTDPETETAVSAAPASAGNYRRMYLTMSAPLKAKTLLNVTNGSPVHVNVALIMPSVVNVFPRAFEVHP